MFISRFYDNMMASIERKCLQRWRQSLLSPVSGMVLEIGAGTGANLVFYNDSVDHLILSEPDNDMRKQLKNKISQYPNQNISINNEKAESLSIPDNSLDYVISTLVCCSVKDLQRSLNEINRVLKPGGRYIFMEHVAAIDGSHCRRWQNLINPLWKKIAGNCHLNRDTESAIKSCGFKMIEIKRENMATSFALVRPTIRGEAVKKSAD